MHFIGCAEWAREWERKYGRENLDAMTLRNLDEMKRKDPGTCCKEVRQ